MQIQLVSYDHATVLVGRITGFARPSVGLRAPVLVSFVTKYSGIIGDRGVARNLIWVGINCTISNLSWIKETKQPHKKFKVD